MKENLILITIIMLITPGITVVASTDTMKKNMTINQTSVDDLDPLVDLSVTVEIKQIRTLEQTDIGLFPISKIDPTSDPDFYVKVFINNEEFTSPIWNNTKYVYTPNWSATADVPDDVELVNITIELWDANQGKDKKCDLSGISTEDDDDDVYANSGLPLFDDRSVFLHYNLKTGHWTGDDWITEFWGGSDPSGKGRLNGCDDNSCYQNDRDCELLFDIRQNDFDGDGIPYWTETEIFHTDPLIDDRGGDDDFDGVPIEWEWKWGYTESFDMRNHTVRPYWQYDPFVWEDHATLDPDEDGLNNIEEYRMSDWDSDPFRKDLFIELDQMEAGPNGEPASIFPEESKELLRTAHDKHNIVYHLDDGSHKNSGSDMIPFDNSTTSNELRNIFNNYFLQGDPNNWKLGVFHYGVVVYQCTVANGNMFGANSFQISSKGLNEKAASIPWFKRDIVYASAYMHECGHTLNIENPAVDDQNSGSPFMLDYWKFRPYKSVMNYGYTYRIVDYSDGSRGKYDFDDWHSMNLTAFQRNFH